MADDKRVAYNDLQQGRTDFTQLVTIGQNLVVAINNLNQTMSSVFPSFVTVPANGTASGAFGQVAVSTSSFYVAYAANSWLKFTGTTGF